MDASIITYRPAIASDRDWLFDLKRATMRDHVAAVYGWDDAVQRWLFEDKFDPAKMRIIRVEGRDAGMLEVEERADHFYLARIEILPALQNQGLGSTVIRSILEDAEKKTKPVLLQVLRPNPARRLYERLGFRVWNESATHYQMRKEPQTVAAVDPASWGGVLFSDAVQKNT